MGEPRSEQPFPHVTPEYGGKHSPGQSWGMSSCPEELIWGQIIILLTLSRRQRRETLSSVPFILGKKTLQQWQLLNQFLTRLVSIMWRCWHISLPYSDETKICAALSPNLSVQLHESFVFQSPHCSCFRNYSCWGIMCPWLTVHCLLHTF